MPCGAPSIAPALMLAQAKDDVESIRILTANKQIQKELNYVTDLLCQLCQATKEEPIGPQYLNMPYDVYLWWQKHEKIDEKRKIDEHQARMRRKIRKKALRRLTPFQRQILGLEKEKNEKKNGK